MRSWRAVPALLLVLAAVRTAQGQEPPSSGASEATPEQVRAWIQALGAESYEERAAADGHLRGCGPEALAPLDRAAAHPDPEVSNRAQGIARHIRLEARLLAWSDRAATDLEWVPELAEAGDPERLALEAAAEEVALPGNWKDVDARLCLALCVSPDRGIAQRMQQRLGTAHPEVAARRLDRAVASADWNFVITAIHSWPAVARSETLPRSFLPVLGNGPPQLRAQILFAMQGWNLPAEEKLAAVAPLLADSADASWTWNTTRLRVCDVAGYAVAQMAGQPQASPGGEGSVEARDANLARWRAWAEENLARTRVEWSAPPPPEPPPAGGGK